MKTKGDDTVIRRALAQCIADAELALNGGALIAERLGDDDLRRAFVSTRSYLRQVLGEGAA